MKYHAIIATVVIIAGGVFLSSPINSGEASSSNKPVVEFYAEEITLSVTDSLVQVSGVYYFRNNTDNEFNFPVFFPFYVDSMTLFPNEIETYIYENEEKIPLEHASLTARNGIRLRIPLKAGDVTIWHLDYQQELKGKCATYIITSTAAWKKPLEKATYYFISPEYFKEVKTWPEADTSYTEDGNTIRVCRKENFMPSQEMQIFWK